MATTALTGTRCRRLTLRKNVRPPGTAPSRENANIILDAAVTDAVPQKNCATQTITRRNSAHLLPSDVCQMYLTSNAPAPIVPFTSGTANVTATSRMKPKITDITTDMTTPHAAAREALRVSSLMCADASYPVYVYCAISRPSPKTNQKIGAEKLCPLKPDALIGCANTKWND